MKNQAKIFEVSIATNAAKGFGLSLVGSSAMEGGDRVNAELQRAPAASEVRQVGVPALAGLNAMREKAARTNNLQLEPINPSSFITHQSAFRLQRFMPPDS
jgi:hypothetical protein